MVSSELEGRDNKEEETRVAYELRIAELVANVERIWAEKETEVDRPRAIISKARNDLQNARGQAESTDKGWREPS